MSAVRTVAMVAEIGREVGHGHAIRARCLADALAHRAGVRVATLHVGDADGAPPARDGDDVARAPADAPLARSIGDFAATVAPTHWVFDLARYTDERVAAMAAVDGRRTTFGLPFGKTGGDVVVNVAEAGDPAAPRERIGDTDIFRGPEHVFLGADVLAARGTHRADAAGTLLLVFGGTDPGGLLVEALRALRDSSRPVIAVCDARHPVREAALALARECPNVRLEDRFERASDFLARGAVLAGAPGVLLFEGTCLGIPVVCFCQNAKQRDDFRHFPDVHPGTAVARIDALVTARLERTGAACARLASARIGAGVPALIDAILRNRPA